MRLRRCVALLMSVVCLAAASPAQQGSTAAVPNLISYSGTLQRLGDGNAAAHTVGISFAVYRHQEGGAPLWLETQNVTPDSAGHYSVLLGSTKAGGIPPELFTTQEQRWLGVQVQGEAEQPRIMLVSVPYAMRAGDAATVGGLPPSAFVSAGPSQSASSDMASSGPNPSPNLAGSGTTDYLPIWTNSTTLGKSTLFQLGTGSSAKVGVNTTSPASTLDVRGAGTFHGLLSLPAAGTATAASGSNSQPMNFVASAFNSNTHKAVAQTFQWRAEAVNNDTANASGTFNLLYASGTAATKETGLKISNKGLFTFATGQTFPGTGTVITIASGAGLSGGSITKTGTLSIANAGVTNAMLQHSAVTVNAGTDLTGGGAVSLGGTTTLNLDTSKVPQLSAANVFTNNNAISVNNINPGLKVSNGLGDGAQVFGGYDAAEFFGGAGGGIYVDTHQDADSIAAIYANEWGSQKQTFGVSGYSASPSGAGIYGVGVGTGVSGYSANPKGTGIYGVGVSQTGTTYDAYRGAAGVWADSGESNATALFATAIDGSAIVAVNNPPDTGDFPIPTLSLINLSEGLLFEASGPGGGCLIDTVGSLQCTSTKSAVVPVDGGSRRVALYAMEAPENWFEDAGSAQLSNGESVVNLEAIFAQTVNTGMDYHVFLTPNGDCKGLYVAQKSPTSFVVRELGGGTSSVAFDYRIMAKRKGYEQVRLPDKTAAFARPEKMRRAAMANKPRTPK